MSTERVIANLLRIAREDLDGAKLLNTRGNRNAIYLCEQAGPERARARQGDRERMELGQEARSRYVNANSPGATASGWGRGSDRDLDWPGVVRTYLAGSAQDGW